MPPAPSRRSAVLNRNLFFVLTTAFALAVGFGCRGCTPPGSGDNDGGCDGGACGGTCDGGACGGKCDGGACGGGCDGGSCGCDGGSCTPVDLCASGTTCNGGLCS